MNHNRGAVALILPRFLDEGRALAGAFESLGFKANRYIFPGIGRLNRVRRFALLHRTIEYVIFNGYFSKSVLPGIRRNRTELAVFLKPKHLSDENLNQLADSKAPCLSWSLDTRQRAPGQASLDRLADLKLFIDGGDAVGDRGLWLPFGCSPREVGMYDRKDIDVLFLGRLGRLYANRRTALDKITSGLDTKRWKVALVGSTGSRLGDSALARKIDVDWIARFLPFGELLAVIGRARLCINIHQDDGVMPVNPLFLEIPAQRTAQCSDNRAYLGQWLENDSRWLRLDDDRPAGQIDELLRDDDRLSTMAELGFEAVRGSQTHRHRAEFICRCLGI